MESSELVVDGTLFTFDEVVRAAHRLSGVCHIELSRRGDAHVVLLSGLGDKVVPADMRPRFFTDLADEKLRSLIRTETRGLHQELVHAALAQAAPRSGAGS